MLKKSTKDQILGNHLFWFLLLLLVNFAAYGAFLRFAPIYDFYNFFFPYRYSIVDAISHGSLPFWNPYQTMGIPAHADPQSGVFYLPVWIFALIFGKYTTVCCAAEFLFHTFVGACGCYLLIHYFTKDKLSAFTFSCAYVLSGFFVGNAQHLVWIISAAWLPWVIYSFILLFEEPGIVPMLLLPITFSLMLTGGYPGFIFILFYLLLILFIFFVIRIIHNKQQDFKRLISFLLGAVFLSFLLSAPALISFWEIQPHITRGATLSFEVTTQPVTIQSLISFFFPYIACSSPDFVNTDISTGSVFIGMFSIPMIFIGLKENKNQLLWILFAFGLVSLLLAFGQAIPTNRILFEYLPFLGLIRLPALCRIYFILSVLIIASVGFKSFKEQLPTYRLPVAIVFAVLCIIFIIIALVSAHDNSSFDMEHPLNGPFTEKLMIEACISAIIAGALAFSLFFTNGKILLGILLAIFVTEGVSQANICGPKTIYDTKVDLNRLAEVTSIDGFPIPDSIKSDEKIIRLRNWDFLWTNVGMFAKEVEYYSYNPVKLYGNKRMLKKYLDAEKPLYLPLSFFPNTVIYDTTAHFLNADTAYTTNPEGSKCFTDGIAKTEVISFRPGFVAARTETSIERPWVLCQNVYSGWEARVDGKKVKLDTLNFTMQTVMVPAGKHTLELRYHRPFYAWIFVLQCVLTLLSVGAIFWVLWKNHISPENIP